MAALFRRELLPGDLNATYYALIALVLGYFAGKAYAFGRDAIRRARILAPMPKAPDQIPLLGNSLPLLRGCSWELMHDWLRQKGPVVHVQIFNMAFVVVGSAEGVKHIFQTGQRSFHKDLDMSFKPFMGILGSGLVTSHGAHWQQQRVKVGPVLRHDMLENLAEVARAASLRLCERLEAGKAAGQPVEMEEEFRKLTLQIIGQAFLSLPPEECDRVFPRLYLPLMTEGNLRSIRRWRMYLPTPSWWRYRRLLRRLDDYVIRVLTARFDARLRGGGGGGGGGNGGGGGGKNGRRDLLDRRIEGMLERGESWDEAAKVQLCYEFKTFLLAGHETSAAMLTWALFELSQHPDKLARVVEEARAATSCSSLREGAEKMEYTLACLKETLRKYSVVPVVTRLAAEDEEICGYKVPKGTYVAAHIAAVHEKEWARPRAWLPERFLPGGEFERFDDAIRPHTFVAFISGPRNCLGQNFALLEARVVLATLLTRFGFDPLDKNPISHQAVIPTGPANGMRMRVL